MAIGFIPKYIEEFPLNNLTSEQFLVIADETIKKLDWKVSHVSNAGIIAYTGNSIFSRNHEVRIIIEGETATLKSSSIGNEMIDWGRNKRNIKDLVNTFNELSQAFTVDELESKHSTISESFIPEENNLLKSAPASASEQLTGFLSVFKPTNGYFITPILVGLNILIFVLMALKGVSIIEPDNESLLNWGANFRPLTLEGQWWRLITNTFLHIGIFHLLLNMYALVYIGLLLEPYLGKIRFISAYLLTGLTASIVSLWWHDITISAGASGAIFGMYGVFLAMLTTDLIEKTARKALLTSIGVFVAYNLINGIKGGIDNAAHIGGLIGGLIIGYCFTFSLKKPDDKRLNYSIIGSLTVLTIIVCAFVYRSIPNDLANYEKEMKQFSSMESMALKVYSLPKDTPKSKLLYEIKDRGIYYWNEDLKIIGEVQKLQLPEALHTQADKLKRYCELRLKSYELLYKTVNEDSNQYQSQIDDYNKQIQGIIDELKKK
jgi:rhomboid protease GluP